ncbi:MAG: signal peptidase I [Dehalococcoidia bacterium]
MKAFVTLQWLLVAMLIVSISTLSLACTSDTILVAGDSMAPTITHEQSVAIDLNAYGDEGPQRWDIIFIRVAQDQGIVLRVIGLPGETITIEDGAVYVNEFLLVEPYLPPGTITESDTKEFIVPSDNYFALGDNRAQAADSREGFFVPLNSIIGKIKL